MFTKAYVSVLNDPSVSYAARVQYCNLYSFNGQGNCFPSIHTQAERLVVGARKILSYNRALRDARWIERARRRHTSNIYRLLKPCVGDWIPLFRFRKGCRLHIRVVYGMLWRMQFGWSRRKPEDYPMATARYLMAKTGITDQRTLWNCLDALERSPVFDYDLPYGGKTMIDRSFTFRLMDGDGELIQDGDAELDDEILPEWESA